VYYLFVINLIIYLCCVKTGISELLNAVKIFESSYHSIAVHFQPECKVLGSYDRAFLMFIINQHFSLEYFCQLLTIMRQIQIVLFSYSFL
jgi:hypothetical protein